MKRVLILSHIYLPYIGGAEIAIKEITDRVRDRDFVMVTGWRDRALPKHEKSGNIEIFRVGLGFFQLDQYLFPIFALLKSLVLNRKSQFNLIWAMMPSQAGLAAMLFKLFRPHIPYLLTDQSGDSDWFWRIRTFFWRPVFKMIYQKAGAAQVISKFLAERAKKLGYRGRIKIVPNGVEIKHFSQEFTSDQKNQFKKELSIVFGEKVIISVSRLVKKNGLDTLIKAVAELKAYIKKIYLGRVNCARPDLSGETNPLAPKDPNFNIKLLIIGSGNQEKRLKKLVDKLELEKETLFLGDIANKQIPKYLSIADVFVRPSRSEGQGIAFLEAMAAGVPVVAPPIGGIVDFIKDRETGLLAHNDNPEELAKQIQLVLTDDALRTKLVNNAKLLLAEKYDWDKIVNEMKSLFESLMKM